MQEHFLREIEDLYVNQYDTLLIYAMRILNNRELAEEAVQESFRIACQKAEVLNKCENKRGWIINTLKNVILNMERMQFRASRRMEEYAILLSNFPERNIIENNEIDLDVLYKDIASLEEYALIKELVLDQKSIRELAESRGISETACKKRVQRAKQVLRKRLENIDDS